jgi:carbon starvation protein CstA
MIQDMLGRVWAPLGDTQRLPANLLATGLCVSAWGYFLYQGVGDPLGGINTLWQLFGVGNQMLAGIALLLCTTVLIRMKRERYAWVSLVPTAWLLVTTLTAGLQKIFHPDPKIGFLAQAAKFGAGLARGEVLAPAKTLAEMQRVVFNNYLDAAVCALFTVLVAAMCLFTVRACLHALRDPKPTAVEVPPLVAATTAAEARS